MLPPTYTPTGHSGLPTAAPGRDDGNGGGNGVVRLAPTGPLVDCPRALARLARIARVAVLALTLPAVRAAPLQATWTTGHKKVLIIPVRFSDQAGPSDDPGPGGYLSHWGSVADGTTTSAVSEFFARQSYGRCTLEFVLLPEIDLGVSYTTYNATYPGTPYSKFTLWHEPASFADDVRAKAREVGLGTATPAVYDTDNYDLDIIACGFIPGQGTIASSITYGKGIYALTYKALAHELCHNLGMQHATAVSRATYYAPLSTAVSYFNTYGDVYCLMGDKDTASTPLPPDRDANACWKCLVGWLPQAQILAPATSGIYRLYAFDQGALEPDKAYAMRIARDPDRTYWYDVRQAITGEDATWSANGIEIRIGAESVMSTSGNTVMLDMTPGSRGPAGGRYATMHDAPLAVGRTYSDAEADLHVTPVRKGGTTPESVDVVVNFGPFPGNRVPTVSISPASLALSASVPHTFTATATDPDGDTLAYYWEFDDTSAPGGTAFGGTNPDSRLCTQGTHAWTRNGTWPVRCTVSDMKGYTAVASATVTVTAGTTAPLTISGVVKDELGNPLANAIVNNYKYSAPNAVTYGASGFAGSSLTAADGKYIIPVPAGATTYYLTAIYKGYNFACTRSGGAVYVGSANVANVDFSRVRATRTISGGLYVAGRGYDPATDGDLWVSAGTQSVKATLGGWTMNVPDGTLLTLTATPDNPAYTVAPYFPNPYTVVDDINLLHLNVRIPGRMPEIAFTSAGATSDDTVGTVSIPVNMTLPAGYTSWVGDQAAYYWVDASGTAEYGVDFRMAGGRVSYYANTAPVPRLIPLRIIHDGMPKRKTVVVKLGPASSVANLGQVTTYTYTILNPGSLTVTAESKRRPHGEANPPLTLAYAGFAPGDDESCLDTLPTATCAATPSSPVGSYPIVPLGGTDDVYSFRYVSGTLTVTPLPHPYDANGDFVLSASEMRTLRSAWATGRISDVDADIFVLWAVDLHLAGAYHYDETGTGFKRWQPGN
jgi:hypothetical protein